jgi:hypothetical protein
MDDLDLLMRTRPFVEPLDPEARGRILARLDERIAGSPAAGSRSHRVRRRSGVLAAIALAAVLVGTAAALVKQYVWTDDQPVALPVGHGDNATFNVNVTDPDGLVDPTTLPATVAEFAPAVRLPEGGSFDEWTNYAVTYYHPDHAYETTRSIVAEQMVLTAQCQWVQQWLTATSTSNDRSAAEAIRVLPGINAWIRQAGVIDDGYYDSIVDDMRDGTVSPVQDFENTCPFRGAWGTTATEQDAKATGDLVPAIDVVRSYLDDGRTAGRFDANVGYALAPHVQWSDEHTQAGAVFPGEIYVAPTTEDGVMLISPSESGTRFCAVIGDAGAKRGIVNPDIYPPDPTSINTPFDPYPGPVACTETGWRSQ